MIFLDESLDDSDGEDEEVERLAEKLYGLIHARFILTNRGLSMMLQKWQDGDFGTCPRVYCYDHPLLPMGTADIPGRDTV
ncbi:casein kinase II regulatory subunit [Ancylostoma duodenale]|uniref:Casein kinase II subunit beta n=1 Tax=Ancylostoma duodenale TaxID=51022 RepID=A0A0C2H7J9_9BILA|nr:casein kinase II regulatory subunit [Ancylostoma duodenale]